LKKGKNQILIILYYWPPSGGIAVQRWLKFVKYFREFDWEPILYLPENPSYTFIDEGTIDSVPEDLTIIRQKIWEPYEVYKSFLKNNKNDKTNVGLVGTKEKKKSFLKEAMLFIRGNFFIPDARKFWVKPSIKFLSKYISDNNIKYIATTGPPHSIHLIGLGLKKKVDVKWLADFRDPWVYMDNYIEDFKFTKKTLNKHIKLEKEVLTNADLVVTVTPKIVEDYEKVANRKVELVTNGFDLDDFKIERNKKTKFVIGHYGTLTKYRNPDLLFKVLNDICNENANFKQDLSLELIGPVDALIFETVEAYNLNEVLHRVDYIAHKKAIQKMVDASILLLLLDKNYTMKGRMTGKLFEYLAAQTVILGLGSLESDPVAVLDETEAGKFFEYDDYEGMKKFVIAQYNNFKNEELKEKDNSKILKYSRKSLTKQLVELLNKM